MTIKELYQLAVANGVENYELIIEDEDRNYWSNIVRSDIGLIDEEQRLCISLIGSEENND